MTITEKLRRARKQMEDKAKTARDAATHAAAEATRLAGEVTATRDAADHAEALAELGRLTEDDVKAAIRAHAEANRDYSNARREAAVQTILADEFHAEAEEAFSPENVKRIKELHDQYLPEAIKNIIEGLAAVRNGSELLDAVAADWQRLAGEPRANRPYPVRAVPIPFTTLWQRLGMKTNNMASAYGRSGNTGIDTLLTQLEEAGYGMLLRKHDLHPDEQERP